MTIFGQWCISIIYSSRSISFSTLSWGWIALAGSKHRPNPNYAINPKDIYLLYKKNSIIEKLYSWKLRKIGLKINSYNKKTTNEGSWSIKSWIPSDHIAMKLITIYKIKRWKTHKSRNTYLQWEMILSLLNQPSRAITIHSSNNNVAFNQLYQQLGILETIPSRASSNLSQVLEDVYLTMLDIKSCHKPGFLSKSNAQIA